MLAVPSSCTDLIFSFDANLATESRIHSSLNPIITIKWHIQSSIQKFTTEPIDEREIWHYLLADADQIRQVVDQFSWEKTFRSLKRLRILFLIMFLMKLLQRFAVD